MHRRRLARAAALKKPLTYDTCDCWRAVQGRELSRDAALSGASK